jgi:uncharacterized membrane protein YdfJ with MMPL/SSD domain
MGVLNTPPASTDREDWVTRRLAELVVAWRWYVIAVWIVFGVALVALAPSLTGFTSAGYGLPNSYQSMQAETIALHDFPAVASASGIIEVNDTDTSTARTGSRPQSAASPSNSRRIPAG